MHLKYAGGAAAAQYKAGAGTQLAD